MDYVLIYTDNILILSDHDVLLPFISQDRKVQNVENRNDDCGAHDATVKKCDPARVLQVPELLDVFCEYRTST